MELTGEKKVACDVLEVYIRENMPGITVPRKIAEYFMSDLEQRGWFGGDTTVRTLKNTVFQYGDGQQARTKSGIVYEDITIPVKSVFTKKDGVYKMLKGQFNGMDEYYDIPAHQVEGNGELFEFPDAEGNWVSLDNIIRMIPTPTVE
jgi:hypothetical protein